MIDPKNGTLYIVCALFLGMFAAWELRSHILGSESEKNLAIASEHILPPLQLNPNTDLALTNEVRLRGWLSLKAMEYFKTSKEFADDTSIQPTPPRYVSPGQLSSLIVEQKSYMDLTDAHILVMAKEEGLIRKRKYEISARFEQPSSSQQLDWKMINFSATKLP